MATDFRRGTDPNAKGDVRAEITAFLDAGVDGFFTDHPDSGVDARDAWLARTAETRLRRHRAQPLPVVAAGGRCRWSRCDERL